MALNAIVLRLKSANRYHVDRPCQYILADGTAAGITAGLKQSGAGSQLLHGVCPDGGIVVADWKTAPMPSGRWTLYNGGTQAVATVISWSVIETPRQIMILVEIAGPICSDACGFAGEILVANDNTLGESATYGHTDGRTIYGLLQGAPQNTTAAGLGKTSNPQSVGFIKAETTRRLLTQIGAISASSFAVADMEPAGYGTGDWVVRENAMRVNTSFRLGYPAWLINVKNGAHWGAITIDGTTTRRIGSNATSSHWAATPCRKDGATADTIYLTRTVATYATWTDFLQAVWDFIGTSGQYWEQDSSA